VYNKNVENAIFDRERKQWLVECSDSSKAYTRWLIPAVGFAARRYTPNLKGLSDSKGEYFRTAAWPQYGVNLKNKRVAVIGTGTSGIRVSQNVGPTAKHLTIIQRTPHFALPMCQGKLDPEKEKKKEAGGYDKAFKIVYATFAGFHYGAIPKATFDDPPEVREAFYEQIFSKDGGFLFWLGNYNNLFKGPAANAEAYQFWRKKVLARVPDPKKQELLAPEKAPHPWGTKRPSLEQNFYEVASLPHVDIVDVNADPVEEVTEKGIELKDGTVVELDVIVRLRDRFR
jgi:cation diffusion facilitator CzcD-associated flavoprotein CzcO